MITILIFHISIAILSLLSTAVLYVRPSKLKLRISAGLVAATVVSGTYLIFATGTNILEVCLVGLCFIAVSLFGMVSAQRRLALVKE